MKHLKLKRLIVVLGSVFLMSLVFVIKNVCATDYYMPDDFANLRAAVAGMNGGDTLIIRDGTYSGTNNVLWQFAIPPSGSSTQYTTIKAEHDGKAIFSDSFLQMTNTANQNYVSYEGLKSESSISISGADHVKFLRCSFTMNVPELSNSN